MIRLRTVNFKGAEIPVFGNWQLAWKHVCDHVFSREECFAWQIVLGQGSGIPFANEILLSVIASRPWQHDNSGDEQVQEAYDEYARAIEQALHDAERLGWYGDSGNGGNWAFGLDGIYVLLSVQPARHGRVRSAFIPLYAGQEFGDDHDSETIKDLVIERGKTPLPRDNPTKNQLAGKKLYYIYRISLENVRHKVDSTYRKRRHKCDAGKSVPSVLGKEEWKAARSNRE